VIVRSGKVQFLFWSAFFSIILYLWLVTIGVITFILPDEKPLIQPQNVILLMFALYGLLIFITLAGVVVSVMIDNKFYRNFFGIVVILLFASLLVAKSLFD